MENPNPAENETAAVSVEVTGLPIPAETAPATEPLQPEIVVIENHIEQTPEGNTQWQNGIESILRQAAENQQNQTLQVIQTIQGFRETMDRVLDCLLKLEKNQSIQSPQPLPPEPEQLPAHVPTENPAEVTPAQSSESQQQTRKRRRRI